MSTCGKIPYVSRQEAVTQTKRLGGTNQRPYACPDCGLWHTTSQRGALRTKSARRRGRGTA